MPCRVRLSSHLALHPQRGASVAKLLYGSGLRTLECLRSLGAPPSRRLGHGVRVKDIDFEQRCILVRDGKGEKDRVTMLPESVVTPLREHLTRVKQLHEKDLAEGHGAVHLPYALNVKYP